MDMGNPLVMWILSRGTMLCIGLVLVTAVLAVIFFFKRLGAFFRNGGRMIIHVHHRRPKDWP